MSLTYNFCDGCDGILSTLTKANLDMVAMESGS